MATVTDMVRDLRISNLMKMRQMMTTVRAKQLTKRKKTIHPNISIAVTNTVTANIITKVKKAVNNAY